MKNCKYCAEEIKDEAILCRYCGKKQENIINKMDEHFISAKKDKGTIENSKGFWLIIYLPSIILMGIQYSCYLVV